MIPRKLFGLLAVATLALALHPLRAAVVEMEYFIGADPGQGNGTILSVSSTANSTSADTPQVSIPHNLPPGTHNVGVRVKDSAGRWSNPLVRRVTIQPANYSYPVASPAAAQKLVAAEFFIGTDPGAGRGISAGIADEGFVASANSTTPLSSGAASGTYSVGLRFRDQAGRWSNPLIRRLTILPASEVVNTIAGLPVGNTIPPDPATSQTYRLELLQAISAGQYFSVTVGGKTVSIQSNLGENRADFLTRLALAINSDSAASPLAHAAANGTTSLEVTAKENGVKPSGWLQTSDTLAPTLVAPGSLGSNARKIVAAEYFVDDDPNPGNGTSIPLNSSGANAVDFLEVSVTTSAYGAGNHAVGVRFKNAAGQWGNPIFKGFTSYSISNPTNKWNQSIGGFGVIGGKVFGSAPFVVSAPTASSGLPVTLSVKNGPASISGNNSVTLTGVGTVTLAANQVGDASYNAAAEVVTSFVVNKGTPIVNELPSALPITYGQALLNSTLSGGLGSVSGSFSFATPSFVPGAGSFLRSVVFTPADSGNYTAATANVTVVVNQAPSSIATLPTATAITFGQALSNSALIGGAGNVAGAFAFVSPTVVPAVGSSARSVVFTPADSGNYTTATANVTVLVNKAPSSITTLPTATAITFGQALSNSTLSGGAGNVAGTFAFATPTVVSAVGSSARSVVFTPTDSGNYTTATANVTVVVNKASSSITTLPTATAITFGQALSNSTLSGGAGNVAGTFAFTTPTVVPAVGSSVRSVVFTPTDSGNYTTATVNVTVLVNKAAQSIGAFATISTKAYGNAPFVVAAPAATSGLPVTLSVKSGNATISANKTVTLTGIGTVILAANQPGNSDYNASPEVSTTFNVTRPISNLTILSPSSSDGSVTQGFAGVTQREVGASYTVSALPASGMLFKEWRKNNTRLTTNATLKFTMQPNLTLTPVFSIDFAKLAGLYNGLVGTGEIGTGSLQDMQSFPVKNGFVAFNLTASGVVSGNLSIEGQTSPFTGKFSSNKTLSISVVRAKKTAAPAALQLIVALPGEISGNITVSGNKLPFRALRAARTTNATEHTLGNRTYTVIIPPPDGVLAGYGFASVITKGNGSALVTGRLATGDAISASAGFVDSGDGNWVLPVYSTSNSILTGEIVIPKVPAPDAVELSGTMEWLRKPAASSAALASGFLKRSNISGARFSIVAGSSLIGGNSTTANFTLAIDPQKRAPASALTQKGIWPANNTPSFIQPVSSGLVMTFSSATGNFTGSFNRMVNGSAVPTAFQGAMFGKPVSTGNGQPLLRGAGYFISGNQSVPVEITLP